MNCNHVKWFSLWISVTAHKHTQREKEKYAQRITKNWLNNKWFGFGAANYNFFPNFFFFWFSFNNISFILSTNLSESNTTKDEHSFKEKKKKQLWNWLLWSPITIKRFEIEKKKCKPTGIRTTTTNSLLNAVVFFYFSCCFFFGFIFW